jgi:type II secretory pathway pseudopilin PulG
LLVVIAIIAVLIGLLLPAVQKVREAGNRSTCQNQLKQLALGAATFEQAQGGMLPAYLTDQWATWAVFILPYIEQGAIYDQWNVAKRYYEQNLAARQSHVKIFFCPSRRSGAVPLSSGADSRSSAPAYPDTPGLRSDYAISYGNTAYVRGQGAVVWVNNGQHVPNFNIGNTDYINYRFDHKITDITDGTSNTVIFGEKHIPMNTSVGDGCVYNGDYQQPNIRLLGYSGTRDPVTQRYANEYPLVNNPRENTVNSGWQFGGMHSGVTVFSFADGSVRTIRHSVTLETLNRLGDRSDGLVISENF